MALAGRTQLHRPLARTQRSVQHVCIRRAQPVSRRVIATQALFSFLQPKQQQAAKNPRAEELTSDLIDICSRGTPSAADVEELVAELSRYSTPNPLRSPLLWGTYDVLYCSKPTAVGGPLKKGPGPAVFPGQKARQTLEEPNLLINEVEFKTLGFLPGRSRQVGTIQPLSGDTFLLNITEGELNTGLGSQRKEFAINRKIQIAYLDDTLRIARFLPDEALEDSEAEQEAAQRESEPILFVFKRVVEEVAEEEEEVLEEEEEEEEQPRAKSPLAGLFGGTQRTTASLATQAERQIRQQMRAEGTSVTSGTGPSGRQQGGTRRMPSFGGLGRRAQEEEEVEDPREARRRAQEEARAQRAAEVEAQRREEAKARAAEEKRRAVEEERARKAAEAEAKARAVQEAKERAEQERVERAERAAAIKELLSELTEEARGAAAATKEAAGELREVQRGNGAVLKQVAAAEAAVAEADEDVAQVAAALEEALAARNAAERELKEAAARLREAQGAYKQQAEAAFGRGRYR